MDEMACDPAVHEPPAQARTDAERRGQLAAWAKALAHPSRVQIVEILLSQAGCMCGDIADQVGSAQSTISQHLKILKQAGIIQGTIDGPRICYCVNPLVLAQMAAHLSQLTGLRSPPPPSPSAATLR